jgi:predicted transcriptional regulator
MTPQIVAVSVCILVYSKSMSLKTITFRVPEERLQVLDSIAEAQQRDRSFVLNEAVAQYLSLQHYHRELIEQGLREDDAGDVIEHEAVLEMAAAWSAAAKTR